MTEKIRLIFYSIIIFFISFLFNSYYANQGVFPLDTFLHYDSSYKILSGELPLRDFWIVHGLVIDYIQALFFKLFGVNWFSYIAHASTFNAVISLTTFYFFLLIKLEKNFSLLLAIFFSTLAYPVSGTPFIDQHSTFFCLLAIYLFSFSIIGKKYKNFFFIPFLLGLGFLSKQVPASYIILILSFASLIYIFAKKNLYILKYLFFGTLFFLILVLLFLRIQNINIIFFINELIFYPLSIGENRYNNFYISFDKLFSNYKFIILTIFLLIYSLIRNVIRNKNIFEDNSLILLIFILFSCVLIFHQFLTKNQNFIFFLIPLNIGLFLSTKPQGIIQNKIKLSYFIIFITLFLTIKYNLRFNEERKFHDLQGINIDNSVPAQIIHKNLFPLNWITRNYKNPTKEIKIIKNTINEIENTKGKSILMTNYLFIDSITKKKLYTISKTYDEISFPNKGNYYYNFFRNYFIQKIKKQKIEHIFLFFQENEIEKSLTRYIEEYLPKTCYTIKNISRHLIRVDLNNCNI